MGILKKYFKKSIDKPFQICDIDNGEKRLRFVMRNGKKAKIDHLAKVGSLLKSHKKGEKTMAIGQVLRNEARVTVTSEVPKTFKIVCACCGRAVDTRGFQVIQIETLWGHQFVSNASSKGLTYKQAEKVKRIKENHNKPGQKKGGVG